VFASPKKHNFESIIKSKGYTYVGLQLNDPTGKGVEQDMNETCFCFETGKDKNSFPPNKTYTKVNKLWDFKGILVKIIKLRTRLT